MESTKCLWPQFAAGIVDHLTADDDPDLWTIAVEEVLADATFLCRHRVRNRPVFACVGSCSHWLSPHNNGSWFRDGRFAWPSGYLSRSGSSNVFSILGLPEFDWSSTWEWNVPTAVWKVVQRVAGKRPQTFRMTVPARTARHPRAVVHALWTPGSPSDPKKELWQAYGFEKSDGTWRLRATCGDKQPYEIE